MKKVETAWTYNLKLKYIDRTSLARFTRAICRHNALHFADCKRLGCAGCRQCKRAARSSCPSSTKAFSMWVHMLSETAKAYTIRKTACSDKNINICYRIRLARVVRPQPAPENTTKAGSGSHCCATDSRGRQGVAHLCRRVFQVEAQS